MVELIAVYSPPMPIPVRKRNSMKLHTLNENAVAAVAPTYSSKVMKNSLRRPRRSASQPEEQRTQHGTSDVRSARQANIAVAEVKRRTGFEGARHRTCEGDFQAIEQPSDAQRDDQQGMKTPPGQAIQPGRQISFEHSSISTTGVHLRALHV